MSSLIRVGGSLGLRHLPVTDSDRRAVGMLTRADLAAESIRSRIVAAAYRPEELFLLHPDPAGGQPLRRERGPRLRGLEQLLRRQAAAQARDYLVSRGGDAPVAAGPSGLQPGPADGGAERTTRTETRGVATWQARLADALRRRGRSW
jgi:hypothetical protein